MQPARRSALKQREALKTGDEKYLPARERGPVRGFARDFVDRRRNVGELLIPFLFVILVFLFIAGASGHPEWTDYATTLVYPLIIIGVVADVIILSRSLAQGAQGAVPARGDQGHASPTRSCAACSCAACGCPSLSSSTATP